MGIRPWPLPCGEKVQVNCMFTWMTQSRERSVQPLMKTGILFPPIRKKMLASKLQNIAKGKVHPHYNSKLK